MHLRPLQAVHHRFFPGGDPHLADAQVAPCPNVLFFLDPPHWCRRLVVVVAVAPPKIVELILQLVAHADGSFLRRGDPFLRRVELRPQLVGCRHLHGFNLAHERDQRREVPLRAPLGARTSLVAGLGVRFAG